MYYMKYCYNNYIINIIHRLCNRQVRNAYTQVTGVHAELQEKVEQKFPMLREKLHFGRVLSVLIFVGMIVGGGSYV